MSWLTELGENAEIFVFDSSPNTLLTGLFTMRTFSKTIYMCIRQSVIFLQRNFTNHLAILSLNGLF